MCDEADRFAIQARAVPVRRTQGSGEAKKKVDVVKMLG